MATVSHPPKATLVIPLDEEGATLELVGDKAATLGRLARAGVPIPRGFCLTTEAYRHFVAATGAQPGIDEALRGLTRAGPATMERAAASIRHIFETGPFPPDLTRAIRRAYARLGSPKRAVAVRASALAEDLPRPTASTPRTAALNLRGEAALLRAVRRCWASFWTARAIAYRERLEVDQRELALAVIIQRFVPADAAGILCTANPMTGARHELVLTASFGLATAVGGASGAGESLPDLYVVERDGLEAPPVAEASRARRVLSDAWLRRVARLGLQVEEHCAGVPQELVWARAAGSCWILRTQLLAELPGTELRQATALRQEPGLRLGSTLRQAQSRGSDHIAAPISTESLVSTVPAVPTEPPVSTAQAAPPALPEILWTPPEPGVTWFRAQLLARLPEPLPPLFADLYPAALEAGLAQLYGTIGIKRRGGSVQRRATCAVVNGYTYLHASADLRWTLAPTLLRATAAGTAWLLRDRTSAYWREAALPDYQTAIRCWHLFEPATVSDWNLRRGLHALIRADAAYWWATALTAGTLRCYEELLERLLAGATVEREHELFAEVDEVAEPLLADEEWIARATAEFGPFRRPLLRSLFRRVEAAAACHEDALLHQGAAWPTLRRLALELGRRLVASGALAREDDVFFLHTAELTEATCQAGATGQSNPALARLVHERRELREAQRRLDPPEVISPTRDAEDHEGHHAGAVLDQALLQVSRAGAA